MCHVKPGPRCIGHIQKDRKNFIKRRQEALEKGNTKRVRYYDEKLRKLDEDEQYTPQGIAAIRAQGDQEKADQLEADRAEKLALAKAKEKGEKPAEEDSESRSYSIPRYKLLEVQRKINKMNKRLERAGIEQRFEAEYEDTEKIVTENGQTFLDKRTTVTLNRPVIKYNGFTFQARVEETEPGQFIAYNAPGQEMDGWRPTSMECEHCGKSRMRSKVYVVQDENGERKVVGGQCVKVYTGLSLNSLSAMEWDLEDDEDDLENDNMQHYKQNRVYNADEALTVTYALTSQEGYRKADDGEESTAYKVRDSLDRDRPPKINKKKLKEIRKEVTEALKDNNGDWATKIKTMMKSEFISKREMGIFVSSMAAIQQKKKKVEWKQGFLGAPKDKIKEVKAEITRITYSESYYGYYPTTVANITMRTADGHRVFWRSSALEIPEEGDKIQFDATIKDHNTFKEQDSTVITRARWARLEE